MTSDAFARAAELARSGDDNGWRPELLRASADAERLALLLERGAVTSVHDRLDGQLRELVRALEPSRVFTAADLDAAVRAHVGDKPRHEYGVWVHYPWSGRLVHLLDADELAVVRTDRNRNKITRDEQRRLAELRVGVIGLSVGQSVCLALTLERGYGQVRVADFDELALSNLNRIRCPLHQLGTNKAIAVAREITELDPFLDVVVYPDGITPANLDAFLLDGGRLDVLVEECDAIGIKLLARRRARELGIAVVMDTSDRGMIDVERFDREPQRPILHGLVDHLDPEAAMRARSDEEKLPFVAAILGIDSAAPRLKASLLEIEETVTTWPQLGSAVMLGGAVTADVVRRIALGQFVASGRWHVDLEQIVADPIAPSVLARQPEPATPLRAAMMRAITARLPGVGSLDESTARRLAEAGSAAPSAGNLQPWRFLFDRGRLLLFHEPHDSGSVFDADHFIAQIGLGACIENVVLAAGAIGLAVELYPLPDEPRLCAAFTPDDRPAAPDSLADQIHRRCSNRRHGDARPLHDDVALALTNAAHRIASTDVHLVHDRARLDELAEICGAAERLRFLHEIGHRELFDRELRWERGPRDGLDVDTLELDVPERTALRMAADPRVVALLRGWGGGNAFTSLAADAIRSSSAMALVSIDRDDSRARLDGGRAAQRLWLAATRLDLAVHPISAPIFLGRPRARECFSEPERSTLRSLYDRTRALFDGNGRTPLFLVRLAHAEPASARSLRRPLGDVFFVGDSP